MSHPVFGIDELLRLVIDELVEISRPAAVSFALTCQSFEEPTLCSLWKRQRSLVDLVRVLSNHTWVENDYCDEAIAVEHDPSVEDWSRLRRYASWMRTLYINSNEDATADTLQRLSNNSPGGILCPRLERLHWGSLGTDNALLFVRLFLSPCLKEVALYSFSIPTHPSLSTAAAQVISLLPTSLEDVSIAGVYEEDEALVVAVSSFVCRCGSSLRSLTTLTPLSETATRHVMQLPNLRSWTIGHGPPRTVLVPILLSLERVDLCGPEALPWLPLLASHHGGTIRNGFASATSYTGIREGLKSITCRRSIIVDPTFLSSITAFWNLATLRVQTYCSWTEGCMFHLTDDDMEDLAAALPRLEILELGAPCYCNSCNNTVDSLLSISVHCLDLTFLETHLNATTIVDDMRRLLDRGTGSDTPKCKLSKLRTGCLPLELHEEDIETVAMGFKVIFPCLKSVFYNSRWHVLS